MAFLGLTLLSALAVAEIEESVKLVGVFGYVNGNPSFWKPDGAQYDSIPTRLISLGSENRSSQEQRRIVFEVPATHRGVLRSRDWSANLSPDPMTGSYPRRLRPMNGSIPAGGPSYYILDVTSTAETKETSVEIKGFSSDYDVVCSFENGKAVKPVPDGWRVFTMVPQGLDGRPITAIDLIDDQPLLEVFISTPNSGSTPGSQDLSVAAFDKAGKEIRAAGMSAGGGVGTERRYQMRFRFNGTWDNLARFEVRRSKPLVFKFKSVALQPKD